MTVTPWGPADELKARALAHQPGQPREEVERNQRERLLGAMVAVVAERGYRATRVADLLEASGVSRNAFYRHFENKLDCFLAVLDFLTDAIATEVLDAYDRATGSWDERLAASFERVAKLVVAQPAAARVGLIEVYVAGQDAVAHLDRIDRRTLRGVRAVLNDSPDHAEMPAEIARAVIGGLRKLIYDRLRGGREDELPDLVPDLLEWALSYRTPPQPLLRPRTPPAELTTERPEAHDARQRILYAVTDLVAERGYPGLVITDIASRAAVSLTTFYSLFESKEEAFLASLDDAQQRVLEQTARWVLAASDWEHGISTASRAFFGFMATEPTTAQFGAIAVWATSPAVLDLRARGLDSFRALLDEGYRLYPDTKPIASEAIGATVDALLFDHLNRRGAKRVYEVATTGAFLALAPFVGTERACELANAEPMLAEPEPPPH